MASSRLMRRSGLANNINTFTKDTASARKEQKTEKQNGADLGEWEEPPLRAPAPSFEDYKGLERQGVLEHMAPLGSLPGQKVKARVRQYEPPRRALHLKNGEARAAREEVSTPDPAPPAVTKRSEPRKESRPLVSSSSKEREEDQDYNPGRAVRITPVKASQPAPLFNGNAPVRTPIAQARLEKIVDSAAKRSKDLGDAGLGLAIKRLYEESNHDRVLADLLDAVLSRKQTPQQVTDFQVYIKAARKQLKRSDDRAKRSSISKSVSKSPGKSRRASVVQQLAFGKDSSSHGGGSSLNHLATTRHSPPKPQQVLPPLPSTSTMSSSKDEPPSKRIKRSGSASSSSSLSSLNSDIEDYAPANVDSTLSKAASRPTSSPKKSSNSSVQPGMGPRLGSFSTTRYYEPNKPPLGTISHPSTNETADEIASRKSRLQHSFQDYQVNDSNVRGAASSSHLGLSKATPPASGSSQRSLRNGAGNRSKQNEDDDLDSPLSSPDGNLLPPSMDTSRAGTPHRLGRPPKVVKKAARIKMSPLKKRNGVTAGIARGGDTDSNFGHGRDDSQHENADVCSACSGNGSLLCCDGCDRAFHFSCCDPPMGPENPPSGEWFCYICMQKRSPVQKGPRGVFGELGTRMKMKNPVAFVLPANLRDFFDGVRTGEEGEYEEVHNVKANKARAGYEEQPNNFKLRDSKENSVLCYCCGKSSMGQREIIGCDFCSLSWHLDCLDPPLASAPNKHRTAGGKPRHSWMCPNHVDSELTNLEASAKGGLIKSHSVHTRKFKIRRPKEVKVIDIGLRRGFKNNGLIEIENDPSEDEDEKEQEKFGVVYRVPERGVKLDFIDRIIRGKQEAAQAQQSIPRAKTHNKTTQTVESATSMESPLDKLPFTERKAALNLAQMARQDASLSSDTVKTLIDTLVAEAPPNVEDLVTTTEKASATTCPSLPPLSEQERQDLQALIAMATRRLYADSSK